ncbi:chemotaxis protein CheD [Phenylobacterium zucineum HLK1]|uniref:Probable chemoreceptor glutamine deamidase CheD n=1 Tax=Phenylobacterium zucineum (strain HLK1) TaxID=450851 RepID=B4RBD8_PHEZH|nr:chemotaxis protein CheD [Phenylobacterium zucineum]ACG79783.1 chemotaxis protein CheD [Phenylobacterium zucineum HLK1]
MTTALAPDLDSEAARPLHVVQGEFRVSDDPAVVLTTVLGSCVAACVRDPVVGVGGMNHFLLPGAQDPAATGDAQRFGAYAMELLVNALLARGAQRGRLEAKLFGGARMLEGLTDVGALNGAFARDYLRREGLAHAGGSLGGEQGRRVQYWPVSGRARQILLPKQALAPFERERRAPAPKPLPVAGELELF